MELILAAACAVAGGAALAAACWRSPRGACVCLGLAAGGVAVLAAVHDAGAAAAVLLVHAAVGLAALTTGVRGTGEVRRRRAAAVVVLGVGTILALALGIAAAEGPSPPYPPRGVTLVLALGGLLLLSAVVAIDALSRGRDAAGPAPGEAS